LIIVSQPFSVTLYMWVCSYGSENAICTHLSSKPSKSFISLYR